MNIAVILAGGIGKRLGAGKPKQFVELWKAYDSLFYGDISKIFSDRRY